MIAVSDAVKSRGEFDQKSPKYGHELVIVDNYG